ncbi:MAG: hypothetical protein ACI85F_001130 [Bacteroidia bacterium]|jgi:hypothetical protein
MTIFKNKKVKYITLGFLCAVSLWIIISLITVFTSSQPQALKNVKLEKFSWLTGQWEGILGDGVFTEKWKIIDENKIIGIGCYVENGDTIFKEELSLIKIGSDCGYISTSDGNAPTLFTLTESYNNTWIFENSEHDFPNRIVYSLKHDDSLFVTVEGKTFGIPIADEYQMKKVKSSN